MESKAYVSNLRQKMATGALVLAVSAGRHALGGAALLCTPRCPSQSRRQSQHPQNQVAEQVVHSAQAVVPWTDRASQRIRAAAPSF